MTRYFVAVLGLVLAAQAGCATWRQPTVRQSFTARGLDRAVFEMECPKEKIELVSLNPPLDDYVLPGAQVGVKGCGKQVVYVAVKGAGWVANTTSGPGESAAH
jgi:hypothetical protein